MLIAQITDMHVGMPGSPVDRFFRTAEYLERAVAHLNALPRPADIVVATGDLVDRGRVEEYERARAILGGLKAPLYVLPGNHDDRANLVSVFGHDGYLPRDGSFLQYTVEDWPVRLITLDTLAPGRDGGELCAQRLAWLKARLEEAPHRPTVILMHHPPFVTGLTAMDSMGLDGSQGLADVVSRHEQVERILCGHLHRPITRRFVGTVACTCPATAYQVALDLAPATRLAATMEPPACMLHLWLGDAQGLVSHLDIIGRDHPPFVLHDGSTWLHEATPPPDFL